MSRAKILKPRGKDLHPNKAAGSSSYLKRSRKAPTPTKLVGSSVCGICRHRYVGPQSEHLAKCEGLGAGGSR